MKIAIVCGHFIPDLGYFEVHLARACSRLGHSVRVITSVKVPGYVQGLTFSVYDAGTVITPEPAYSIHRLPAILSAGQMVLCNGVKKSVRHFDPDLVFVIGLGKLFPSPVFDMEQFSDRTITLLGDNEHSFSDGSLRTKLVRKFLKKRVYRKAIQNSKYLFAYTASTQHVVAEQVGEELAEQLRRKLRATTLGFDGTVFYFDPKLRESKRAELELKDAFTWICVSRISANKDFRPFLHGLQYLNKNNVDFKALLVGASGKESELLRVRINDLGLEQNVELLPFQEHADLNALYNAADAAWYPMAAVSNFEGLGTGLPILLPDEQNVSHILKNRIQGSYYTKENASEKMLEWTERNNFDRTTNAAKACGEFEYKSIVRKMLQDCLPA